GFVSLQAKATPGGIVSRPLRYTGRELELNHVTRGTLRVELQDESGRALPGYAMEDCLPITGDAIAQVVKWKTGPGVEAYAGKPVRLRIEMTDADLFSMKFNA